MLCAELLQLLGLCSRSSVDRIKCFLDSVLLCNDTCQLRLGGRDFQSQLVNKTRLSIRLIRCSRQLRNQISFLCLQLRSFDLQLLDHLVEVRVFTLGALLSRCQQCLQLGHLLVGGLRLARPGLGLRLELLDPLHRAAELLTHLRCMRRGTLSQLADLCVISRAQRLKGGDLLVLGIDDRR